MKLVVIPDSSGDFLNIIDEKFPPELYIEIEDTEEFKRTFDFDDLLTLITSFNE